MGQVLLDLDSAVQMLYGVWPIISILLVGLSNLVIDIDMKSLL